MLGGTPAPDRNGVGRTASPRKKWESATVSGQVFSARAETGVVLNVSFRATTIAVYGDELEISRVMERLMAGDPTAEALVVRRYTMQLIALARRQLSQRIRQKTSPEDAVQSAFGSFFKRLRRGQFDLANWDSLWSLLAVITVRKCAARRDYFHASRRDVRRELGSVEATTREVPISREPCPDEALALAELVERLLRDLSDAERPIVGMCLEGYSIGEICRIQGRAERTVRRVLTRARYHALRLTEFENSGLIPIRRRSKGSEL